MWQTWAIWYCIDHNMYNCWLTHFFFHRHKAWYSASLSPTSQLNNTNKKNTKRFSKCTFKNLAVDMFKQHCQPGFIWACGFGLMYLSLNHLAHFSLVESLMNGLKEERESNPCKPKMRSFYLKKLKNWLKNTRKLR